MRPRAVSRAIPHLVTTAFLLGAATRSAACQEPMKLEPERIGDAITNRGARAVLDELFRDASVWDALIKAVESGDPRWLRIAKRFQGTAEAGGAQELQMAVGGALERNPEGVLRLLRDGYSKASVVCGLEGVEDGLGVDYQQALGTVSRRQAAIERGTSAELKGQRRDCLQWLGRLEVKIRHHEKDWFAPH
jgi:hypothetical protein